MAASALPRRWQVLPLWPLKAAQAVRRPLSPVSAPRSIPTSRRGCPWFHLPGGRTSRRVPVAPSPARAHEPLCARGSISRECTRTFVRERFCSDMLGERSATNEHESTRMEEYGVRGPSEATLPCPTRLTWHVRALESGDASPHSKMPSTLNIQLSTITMSFDPTLPATNSEMRSEEMRNQFNGLKDVIDLNLPASQKGARSDGGRGVIGNVPTTLNRGSAGRPVWPAFASGAFAAGGCDSPRGRANRRARHGQESG